MHRAAPFAAATRAFSAGGARSLVDKVDDKKLMQEMGGTHMKGESGDKIKSPQNYGFTSVVMPADKDKDGNITESAEAFLSFIGGNRSFPVAAVMDDRRYRLKELENGDVAFFDHLQHQVHMNKDGVFVTGRDDKKVSMQLVEKPQEQGQQSGQQGGQSGGTGVTTFAESGASGGTASGAGQTGGQKKKDGQKARYKKESKKFIDISKDTTEVQHDKKINVKAGKSYKVDAPAISHKGTQYFDKDVHIMGKLYVGIEAYKPSDGSWEAGAPSGGPTDFDDPIEYVTRPPPPLSAEQQAFVAHKRALADKIKITDDGIFIDGDLSLTGNLTVTGDLTINGKVRAKAFETLR